MNELPSRSTGDDAPEWKRFEALLRVARTEPVPTVNVVAPVLQQIAAAGAPSLVPQQRVLMWGAGVSALVAASLVFAVWTATQTMTDPAAGSFQPFEVALLEGP